MTMAHIFLLAGAPAVGKSSTARGLAAQFQKSIHIPVDDLRDMVVSGLMLPGKWNEQLVEQLTLARASAVYMSLAYSRAGFVVVMDDFWDPHSQLQEYRQLFLLPNFYPILLLPSEQTAHERNLQRSGPGDASQYIADGIRTVYARLPAQLPGLERQGWQIVNTSEQSIAATVSHVLARVSSLPDPAPAPSALPAASSFF